MGVGHAQIVAREHAGENRARERELGGEAPVIDLVRSGDSGDGGDGERRYLGGSERLRGDGIVADIRTAEGVADHDRLRQDDAAAVAHDILAAEDRGGRDGQVVAGDEPESGPVDIREGDHGGGLAVIGLVERLDAGHDQ